LQRLQIIYYNRFMILKDRVHELPGGVSVLNLMLDSGREAPCAELNTESETINKCVGRATGSLAVECL
jgi:hypothetical protein